ncbi:putative P-loop containing nucleoside triphosphate hydrolase [Rosa chinensis]|uniref:Putative P-loop containing nucleoside triphosphate hydrolase n=1 Tax=Rosa chinensis TaxID=74649 RepID=A0A2P6PFA0_ROSCH|nr:disease resistance RPP13-like protein 4 [Rosa chinensis]XP_024175280.1 disease resistance RPP13-like protein 4 [Rosa chinensis]XP_024175282.1 disease resistance RPP13-like protein 4 [Rosa chinensis]XP_024175283.1 disease resistance RPP13-like protein 4 [Rosa chinensis]XP_024175284.1 disease resistance RPP13-like protein 4 [Rosa chinensis]XP_040367764.1 disease resistance RPP13-like protein 4 [Rosa chinensis]XP_040367765.1 disease resistance RPP13-like protein 4 [Rosa chinensis]XP_04036776
MALDVAELLWSKFLKSLAELDSESNSGSITISVFKSSIKALVSDFEAIKDVVNERDIMPEPYTHSETINLLYKLNDALADCRVFTHECMELDNVISRFNFRRFTFVAKVKSRLTKLKQELENLPQQPIGNPRTKTEFTGSGPKVPSAKVFGFDEQLKEINEELLQAGGSSSSSAGELRAIGVVGIAGVGKTTLVQKVLESEEVKQKFNHMLWLPFSLSEEEDQYSKFSFETRIFDSNGQIIEARIVGLDKLLERLSRLLLSDKCYLIVLDDVCHRHINIMERLCSGLPKHNGGVVIVTTRLEEVAQKLGKQHRLHLVHVKPLDREICGRIFEEQAYSIRKSSNFSRDEATRKMEELKDQCHGLPLAAKTIANAFAVGFGGDGSEERDGHHGEEVGTFEELVEDDQGSRIADLIHHVQESS